MAYLTAFILGAFLLLPQNILAQVSGDDLILMEQVIDYSSQADAYNFYCQKEGRLSDSFVEKLADKRDLSKLQLQGLVEIKDSAFKGTGDLLVSEGKDCNDLELMMNHLDVMKKLKDASYLLNGVDPETLPAPEMPDISELLPEPK